MFPNVTSLTEAVGAAGGVICAVGAGGKKTALYRLARELPGRTALTATVLTPPFASHVQEMVLHGDPLPSLRTRVRQRPEARAFGTARPSEKPNRWAGLFAEEIDALAGERIFDAILVKADGARLRWIKAPAADEPIFPSSTTLVLPVVSARVIGEPLSDRVAHRPEAVARLTGARIGAEIRPEHVAAWLVHPEGALKSVGSAAVVPLINMVDDEGRRPLAARAAEEALTRTQRFDRVVLTALRGEEPVVEIVRRR